MIMYSADAEAARAFLLRQYNDIDVFVEDIACQNMYVRLLGRMMGSQGRINNVYPLHGRANVIARCSADQGQRNRKRLYIIDADHDLICGRPAPKLKHLYRLQVYCSENLLLSENALIAIGTECEPQTPWSDLAIRLALRPLLERSVRLLLPLFVVYAVVHQLRLPIETVDYSVHRLLATPGDPLTLSETLIRTRILSLLRAIRSQVTGKKYRAARNEILRRVKRNRRDHSVYISGKAYLLPLAYLQLKRLVALNESLERVKVRLAQHSEMTIDSGLLRALRMALRNS